MSFANIQFKIVGDADVPTVGENTSSFFIRNLKIFFTVDNYFTLSPGIMIS